MRWRFAAPSGGLFVSGSGAIKFCAAGCAEAAAIDLRCGAEEPLLPSARWAVQMRLEACARTFRLRVDSPLELRVSPNSIHVLRHAAGLWEGRSLSLGSRLFVANRTSAVLFLQQADRTRQEALRLAPGEARSWRWILTDYPTFRRAWRIGVLLADGKTVLWSPEAAAPDRRGAIAWDSPRGRLKLAIVAQKASPTVTKVRPPCCPRKERCGFANVSFFPTVIFIMALFVVGKFASVEKKVSAFSQISCKQDCLRFGFLCVP